jgi:hypothetical protein
MGTVLFIGMYLKIRRKIEKRQVNFCHNCNYSSINKRTLIFRRAERGIEEESFEAFPEAYKPSTHLKEN